MQSVNS